MARPWLPTDATSATLVGWFDAQDASTLTVENGGGISAWRSKVGGWGVTQATAANQPPYSTYNNLPAVFPTTDSQFLSGAAPAALPTGGDAGSMTGVGTVIAYRNTYSTMFYYGSANQNKARSIAATGNAVSSGYYGNDVQGNVAWPGYTRLFISSISATGYAEQWVDGGAVQAAQKNVLSTPAGTTFWVCRSINGDPWKNPVQEICLWKGTLSADERALLEGYYAWRWNLVAQLPAGHRWKNAQPTISGGPTLSAGSGGIVLIGRTANLLFGHTLPAAAGTLTVTGQAVRTLAGRRLVADGANFATVGSAAALMRTRVTSIGNATFSLSSQPANLLHGFTMPAAGGAFALTGVPARLRAARRLVADGGAFLTVGQAIDLRRVGRLEIRANAGQFAIVGQAAGTRAARRLVAAPGALLLTGGTMTMSRARSFALGRGAFAVTGSAAMIGSARRIAGEPLRLLLAGRPAGLRLSRRLIASSGAFVVDLNPAIMIIGKPSAPIVVPAARRFTLASAGSRHATLTSSGSRRLTI